MTAMSIYSLHLLISTSSSTNPVTFLFLVLSVLKTLNNLSMGSVVILSSFTSCLSISVWIHPESTSVYNYNSFSFLVLMFVYMLNSLALLFYQFGITYQFWELLCTEVHCIVPTPNLQQNSLACHLLLYLFLPIYSNTLSFVLFYNLLIYVLLCYICSTLLSLFLFLVFNTLLSYICMHCN